MWYGQCITVPLKIDTLLQAVAAGVEEMSFPTLLEPLEAMHLHVVEL